MELSEETWLRKGTPLYHRVYGRCRLKWLETDKFCYIINKEKNKAGCPADGWGRIVEGRLLEWDTDHEIGVLK